MNVEEYVEVDKNLQTEQDFQEEILSDNKGNDKSGSGRRV